MNFHFVNGFPMSHGSEGEIIIGNHQGLCKNCGQTEVGQASIIHEGIMYCVGCLENMEVEIPKHIIDEIEHRERYAKTEVKTQELEKYFK